MKDGSMFRNMGEIDKYMFKKVYYLPFSTDRWIAKNLMDGWIDSYKEEEMGGVIENKYFRNLFNQFPYITYIGK